VDHPNVLEIIDLLDTGKEPPLLVMELLSGQTLAERLRRTPRLSVEQTARLLLPVVSAVGTAHSLGIVHRDLKPGNIFLHERKGGEPFVKVLDFGLAKWVASLASPSDPRTREGLTLGTLCYMAPEQAAGQRTVTHRVDIWSLGVLLYECLAGTRPVEGKNLAEVATKLRTGIMPIDRLGPTLPAELSKLIAAMLSRDAAKRPQDLREVFALLSSYTTVSAPAFGPPDVDLVMGPDLVGGSPPSLSSPQPTASASGSPNTASAPLASDVRAYRFRRAVTVAAVAAAVLGLLALVQSSR
jgi:serine/threonine protein kinase